MSSVVTAKFLIVRGVNPGARTPINVTVIDSAMTALGHEHACAAATSVVRSRTHSCHSRHATLPLLPFGAVQRLAARRQLWEARLDQFDEYVKQLKEKESES